MLNLELLETNPKWQPLSAAGTWQDSLMLGPVSPVTQLGDCVSRLIFREVYLQVKQEEAAFH